MERPIKLLLVDDEPLALRRIRSFGLAAHGFEVIGTAENGAQALQSIDHLQPDIVVSDIGMPVMDGLAMLQTLQQLPAPPKVVLLTCYEDFEKVQVALRLGAADYVTKVMLSEEELLAVLQRTAASLRKEYAAHEQRLRLQLQDWLQASAEPQEDALRAAGLVHSHYALAIVRTAEPLADPLADELLACPRTGDSAAWQRGCLPVRMAAGLWCLYFYALPRLRDSDASFFAWYSGQCKELLARLRQQPAMGDYICATGPLYHRPGELPLAYKRGLAQCEAGFYLPAHEPVRTLEQPPASAATAAAPAQPPEQLRELLPALGAAAQRGDAPAAAALLRAWAAALGAAWRPQPGQARQLALAMHAQLAAQRWEPPGAGASAVPGARAPHAAGVPSAASIASAGGAPHAAGAAQHASAGAGAWAAAWQAQLDAFKRAAEAALHATALRAAAEQLAELLLSHPLSAADGCMRQEIKQALALIASQYATIELAETARQVNLSPSWFAALFRAETGQSFHGYVQEVRLNQAKHLLRTTDWKVYEIAEQIGIANSRYFSRLFSEQTGQSPLDYRKSSRHSRKDQAVTQITPASGQR